MRDGERREAAPNHRESLAIRCRDASPPGHHASFGGGGVIRAGIGEFRSLLGPELVAPATAATGLSGATQRLVGVGSAVPAAAWAAWTAGDRCGIPTAYASTAYASAWHGTQDSIEVIGSYNLSQPGLVDANFAGTPRFTLGSEGGRPVFVSPGAIDPASGALSAAEGRRRTTYGRVAVQRRLTPWPAQGMLIVTKPMTGYRTFNAGGRPTCSRGLT